MKLPAKDSATGRALRVAFYQVPMLVLALLTNPQTVELILQYFPELAAIVTLTAPTVSFLYNFLRKDVKNY